MIVANVEKPGWHVMTRIFVDLPALLSWPTKRSVNSAAIVVGCWVVRHYLLSIWVVSSKTRVRRRDLATVLRRTDHVQERKTAELVAVSAEQQQKTCFRPPEELLFGNYQ